MTNPQMVMYEEEFNQIQAIVVRLVKEANARVVFVIDKNGQEIAKAGETDQLDTTSLASLTAGNIAATGGMAKLLRENEFTTQFHEGEKREHPHPDRRQPRHPRRHLRQQDEPRPRPPAREEGERGAQQHLRGAAPQGAGPEP
jgi:hypothetical protein